MDPLVREAMLPYLDDHFGNPHSVNHSYGWNAAQAVRTARGQVAELIGADDHEIVFTSGATESCNLAIRGTVKPSGPYRNRIITVATEHPAVLETVQDLGCADYDVAVLPVDNDGRLDLAHLERMLDDRTVLVSVMAANNEIGVLHPLHKIAELCHAQGALVHTDATQASGRIEIDVDLWGVDLLSLSAHKVYGPKGIGALYVRSGVPIEPIATGGGQEHGLRPGTVPAPLAVGFGAACRLACEHWHQDAARMSKLAGLLSDAVRRYCPDVRFFGDLRHRLPGSLSIGFPGITADEVIEIVSDRIAISTGSACSSGTAEPSKVLLALGLDRETAATGVRISLGRFTTDEEIEAAIGALAEVSTIAA
ncbi:MAG: cysteine desulfurase family protein, partial [Chloroflexota bacterium]|nr:cysteine desulfurase family protein [Chloroflexota bacterium]